MQWRGWWPTESGVTGWNQSRVHSALLDPILDEFESYAGQFDSRVPQRILIDNQTGPALGKT